MLPRSRLSSIFVLGLGAALVAIGALLPALLNKEPKMPLSLPPTSYVMRAAEGISTRINPDGVREEVTSPIRRQLHGELIEPADKDKVSLRVGVTEMREMPGEVVGGDPLTELIDANVWTFTIDRLTGEFLAPATIVDRLAGVPRELDVKGNWVKFPAGTEQKEYLIFDDFMRDSVPAAFVAEEDRNGTPILHFRQSIPKTNLAQKYRSAVSQLERDGKSGFLQYEGTRDWWVEPKSGSVIDVAEDINLWWETREGEPIMTYLRFKGAMSPDESARLLGGALTYFESRNTEPWAIALLAMGAILMFGGMIGVVRPTNKKNKKVTAGASGNSEQNSAPDEQQSPRSWKLGRKRRRIRNSPDSKEFYELDSEE